MVTVHYALPFLLVEQEDRVGIWQVSQFGMARIWEREKTTLVAASVNYNNLAMTAIVAPPTTLIYSNAELKTRQIEIPSSLAGINVFSFHYPVILYTRSYPSPRLCAYNPILGTEQQLGDDIISNPPLTAVRNNEAVSRFVVRAERGNKIRWRIVREGSVSHPVSGYVCNLAAAVPQYCVSADRKMRIATIEHDTELAEVWIRDCSLDNATIVWGTVENNNAVLYFSGTSLNRTIHVVTVFCNRKIVWARIIDSPPVGAFVRRTWCCVACENSVYSIKENGKEELFVIGENGWKESLVSPQKDVYNVWCSFSIKWQKQIQEYVIGF